MSGAEIQDRGEEHASGLAPPSLTSCVTLGKSLNPSESQDGANQLVLARSDVVEAKYLEHGSRFIYMA